MVQVKPLRDKYVQVIVEAQDQLLEFGRQRLDEPPPLAIQPYGGGLRLIIAELQNTTVARHQLRMERAGSDSVRVTNIHEQITVSIDGQELAPAATREVRLPIELRIGNIQLHIETAESAGGQYQSLAERPPLSGTPRSDSKANSKTLRATLAQGDQQSLLYRLEQLVVVLQASASSPDFMDQVAAASVELIELDHAAVVLWKLNKWDVVAVASARPGLLLDSEWNPSRSLLNQMRTNRRTTWSSPQQTLSAGAQASLVDVVAFVAAPILDPQGDVIGAVYGDRRTGMGGQRQPIEQIDAQLVEILACGIAGGLQRLEKEREVLARRLQFEQFVTAEVANQIEEDPESLTGRDADVTMLFCDIAGFSRISEKLSPQQTFEWINDVMLSLSACVKQHGGTIVDYVGDELIAMWGAPFPVEHHAPAACRAAIAMIHSLPDIDRKWQGIVHVTTQVGVGVNSGTVRVGNTGCQLKFKYGALGSTVNIASRIQGATRYLRTPILITGATAELLRDEFPIRRLCQVRVKNIDSPIDIFELPTAPPDNWETRRKDYGIALQAWEQGSVQDAVNSLSQIVATYRDDVPALVMLARAIEVWSHGQAEHDPVWTLPSK